jgi:CheY-like chemotaxis protein
VRVLVVDDVALNRDVLKELLLHFGYSVTVAQSGEAALQCVDAEHFDAVITDVFQPGMDGIQLGRRLRKQMEGARIIGLTAALDVEIRWECFSVGFDMVLAKPVSGETLHRSLLGLIDRPQHPDGAPVFAPDYLDSHFETLGTGQTLQIIACFRETVEQENRSGLCWINAAFRSHCQNYNYTLGREGFNVRKHSRRRRA